MTKSPLLLTKINDSGLKLSYIAANIGLSYAGLRKKLDGETDFKASEIVALSDLLNLSKSDRDYIFLSD